MKQRAWQYPVTTRTGRAVNLIRTRQAERIAHAAVQGMAEALQRSLLTEPPQPADLEIVVRYLLERTPNRLLGLVERRGADLDDGVDWLRRQVAELRHLSLDELCDRLLAELPGALGTTSRSWRCGRTRRAGPSGLAPDGRGQAFRRGPIQSAPPSAARAAVSRNPRSVSTAGSTTRSQKAARPTRPPAATRQTAADLSRLPAG